MKICPRCGNRSFKAKLNAEQWWYFDSDGEVVDKSELVFTANGKADVWECEDCGYKCNPDCFEYKNKYETFRLAECVFDLTTIACMHKFNELDVDSREVLNKIYELASEFENSYDETDDYYTAIEAFGIKRLGEYFKKYEK